MANSAFSSKRGTHDHSSVAEGGAVVLQSVHNDGTGYTTKELSTSTTGDQDCAMSITLPTAGTWLVMAKVRTRANATSGGRYIRVKLKLNDTTTIANTISNYDAVRAFHTIMNEPLNAIVTTTSTNETIDVYAAVSAVSVWTYARVESDINGYTTLTALRIA